MYYAKVAPPNHTYCSQCMEHRKGKFLDFRLYILEMAKCTQLRMCSYRFLNLLRPIPIGLPVTRDSKNFLTWIPGQYEGKLGSTWMASS
jgi:hypothetical protein